MPQKEAETSEVDAIKIWLRELRKGRGLSQRALADIVHVTTKTIVNAERLGSGESLPQGITMMRILRELGAVADVPVEESPLERRLRLLEEKVAGLPTAKDLREGLETLRVAIRPEASAGTRASQQGKRAQ